jgi:uroporphyrinogen decarboxylase
MKLSSLTLFLTLCSVSGFTPQFQCKSSALSRLHSAAISKEEDLELTRKVILAHMNNDDIVSEDEKPTYTNPGRPKNDLMIRAALGREPVERTPVWLFRQAGRHLPEYHAYKQEKGRSFLDMLSFPEDVAECTLQPVRRYPIDAAILFSDILVIAEALNIEVTMPGGVGILVPNPLQGPEEVSIRIPSIDDITPAFIHEKLGTVLESVKLIRKKMEEENISVPLIGFSGAPFALLFYMIGGSSRKNTDIGMKWLNEYPKESQQLLDVLTKIIIEYMSAQVEAGAHMLQLFEAMGMMLEEKEFEKFALPCLEKIGKELKSRYPDVPLMVFARGAGYVNEKLSHSDFDIVTMDGEVDRNTIRVAMGDRCGLQGSYDPRELIEENGKSPDTVKASAKAYLDALGPQRLIANLGEGLGGKESPALVQVFVDTIHEYSEELIKKGSYFK